MIISTKGRYAIRIMIDIAINSSGKYVVLKDIAKRQGISLKYLEQIINILNKTHLIKSLRGNNGGYMLTKPASEYTTGEILRLSESCLAPSSQSTGTENDVFAIPEFWAGLENAVDSYMDSITLQELADSVLSSAGDNYSI